MKIEKSDFPHNANDLTQRGKNLLSMSTNFYHFGNEFYYFGNWIGKFTIKEEDGYYYTHVNIGFGDVYNRFDGFSDLKDYLMIINLLRVEKRESELLDMIKNTKIDLSFDDNYLFRMCCSSGYFECVQFLLKIDNVNPNSLFNYGFRMSCFGGHIEIVKLLLSDPRIDPNSDPCRDGISRALETNRLDIINLLLNDPRVDPSVMDNCVLKWAIEKNHKEIIKVLLKDKRVTDKMRRINYAGSRYLIP